MVERSKPSRRTFGGIVMAGALTAAQVEAAAVAPAAAESVLPSWRDGAARRALLEFLHATTDEASPDHVAPADRVAVFDNDGTLWTEQPVLPEVAFSLHRLRELAPAHPEWLTQEPFRSALAGDKAGLARGGVQALVEIAVATQAGATPEAFHALVADWLKTSRDPRFGRPYSALVYQPMLEVLDLFGRHGFACFIVSAGAVEFLRAWTTSSYGLPADRVIGSTLELDYVDKDGRADLVQTARFSAFTNGPHKAGAIASVAGRRPIAAFGNSDGDYEMLRYATTGPGRRLGMLIHHDDAEREYAYDRHVLVGALDRALNDAPRNGWQVVSMKDDWAGIYPRAGPT